MNREAFDLNFPPIVLTLTNKKSKDMESNRRKFLRQSLTTAAGLAAATLPGTLSALNRRPIISKEKSQTARVGAPLIRFAAIGLNHGHINGQVETVIRGGGELVSFYAKEPDLIADFSKRFPQAKLARSEKEILED